MIKDPDSMVVGAGPSGSFAALNLARLNVPVRVFEEHGKVGVPSHCAGHLSIAGLKKLGLHPLPRGIVENTFYGADFYSPKGNMFSVHFSKPMTCAVDRSLFDEYIAEKAKDAGADFSLNSRVESLIIDNGFVRGAVVRHQGTMENKQSKIVVDAEGISSRILKEAGLRMPDRHCIVRGIETEVENIENSESDHVDVYLGKDYAPGFYAWLIPKRNGKAKVGLAAKTGNTEKLLQRLMFKHPVASRKLKSARILKTAFHPIPLGGPTQHAYANGFLAVGDAASQVKPTTGGGVVFGMTCAQVAAGVVYEALQSNDFSRTYLSRYGERCKEIMGFDTRVMLTMRKALNSLSDGKLDDMIALSTRLRLEETLQNVEDIDSQGQAFLRVLKSPRMLTVLGYISFLLLSANL